MNAAIVGLLALLALVSIARGVWHCVGQRHQGIVSNFNERRP